MWRRFIEWLWPKKAAPPEIPKRVVWVPPKKRERVPYTWCSIMEKRGMNERDAKSEAARFNINMRAYKCEFCPHWHLTKKRNGYLGRR